MFSFISLIHSDPAWLLFKTALSILLKSARNTIKTTSEMTLNKGESRLKLFGMSQLATYHFGGENICNSGLA